MGNDYMFRAVLQESEEVLKNLIATLMQMDEEEIRSCRILNPIVLGQQIDKKDTILDVRLDLNDDTIMNIELQMWYQNDWVDRSLYYWARTFAHLKKGENYSDVKPTYHIGILDFSVFQEEPEFYSEYRIQNVKTGREYSSKFCLRILDLTQIEHAKRDPNTNQALLKWAQIVKAETISELEQLAGNEEALRHMVSMVKKLSEEEKIQLQCEAREDYERRMSGERNAGYRDGKEVGIQKGIQKGISVIDTLLDAGSISPKTAEEAKKLLEDPDWK